jgi:hypothetical protein
MEAYPVDVKPPREAKEAHSKATEAYPLKAFYPLKITDIF